MCTCRVADNNISLVRGGRAQRTDWRIFWKEVGVYTSHRGRSEGFKPYRRSKGRNPPFFDVVAFGSNIPEYGQQRVFNDLQRGRPSRCRMIWLLAHPLPPVVRPATQRKTEKERQLADGRGAQSYDRKKPCPL
jgi:hypothetical protein